MADESHAQRSRLAMVMRPLALFVVVSAIVFTVAQLELAKPGVPSADPGTQVAVGDAQRGSTAFEQTCAGCHGAGGEGGVGPRLIDNPISLAAVNGRRSTPAGCNAAGPGDRRDRAGRPRLRRHPHRAPRPANLAAGAVCQALRVLCTS